LKRLKANFQTVRVTPDFTMSFSTNSLGARGPEPQGELQGALLFLGDSFTMGYGVSDGQEFPALIQQELRRRQGAQAPYVLNLGMGASGNGFWLKRLKLTAPAIKPSLVVLQVLENDFWDNQVEGLYALDAQEQLLELPVPRPGLARRAQNLIETLPALANSNLVGLMRQAMSSDPGFTLQGTPVQPGAAPASQPARTQLEPGEKLTPRIVEAAIRECQRQGWPVVLLSVGLQGPQRASMRALAQATRTPFLETPAKAERPELYFQIDGHWNAQGNADTAQRLLQLLDELKLIRPAP
jgi:GDSL-like Lipase/Acylhydrolase family